MFWKKCSLIGCYGKNSIPENMFLKISSGGSSLQMLFWNSCGNRQEKSFEYLPALLHLFDAVEEIRRGNRHWSGMCLILDIVQARSQKTHTSLLLNIPLKHDHFKRQDKKLYNITVQYYSISWVIYFMLFNHKMHTLNIKLCMSSG